MGIPEFDMRVLADITSHNLGYSPLELTDKYGFEISETIDFLLANSLIKVHEKNLKPFMPSNSDYQDPPIGNIISTRSGKIEVKRWQTNHYLTRKERWKERGIGALVTLVIWAIQEIIKHCI